MLIKGAFVIFLIILLLAGFPVAYGIGIASVFGMFMTTGIQITTISSRVLGGLTSSGTMMCIPLFLLAGKLMNHGGVTRRLFGFADKLVGWLPGGLGHVNVAASVIFAGMSGSAIADLGGLGAIEIQAMRDKGFDDDFSAAVTGCSSLLGPMIPPSVVLILYSMYADGASVGALLMAGVIPGLLMAAIMMVVVAIYAIIRKYPREPFPKLRELFFSFVDAIPSMMTVVIILVGIYTGICTTTESAALACLWAMFLAVVVYKECTFKQLLQTIVDTVTDMGSMIMIIAFAALFGNILLKTTLPAMLAKAIASVCTSKVVLMLAVNALLLICGMFLESTAAMAILVPILLPVLTTFGVSPVQFGIIYCLNFGIGGMTPPFGVLIFMMERISGISSARLIKAYIPWIAAMLVALLLITFIPGISLFLPTLAGFKV